MGKPEIPDWDSIGFAFVETDCYFRADAETGRDPLWSNGEFLPHAPVTLPLSAAFFSYGLGIFEGIKAQRSSDGRVLLFRHRENARRFTRSAERLSLPPFPEDRFAHAAEEIVRRNLRFVPPHGRGSFYIRPLEHAIDALIGVSTGNRFWVLMFGCPVGSYFAGKQATASNGLRLHVLEQGRVAAGGTGSAKAIGNYAGGISLAGVWKQQGFDDVLYLDARHVKYLTETSASNVFVKLKNGALVTPPLDDQILAGVTRDSVLRIARDVLGVTTEERPITLDEALSDAEEIFCTGTAWTVRNVYELEHRGVVRNFPKYELQQALLEQLLGAQTGAIEDRFGWTTEIEG